MNRTVKKFLDIDNINGMKMYVFKNNLGKVFYVRLSYEFSNSINNNGLKFCIIVTKNINQKHFENTKVKL